VSRALVPLVALTALPALACGPSGEEVAILIPSAVSVCALAVLFLERGVFALAAHTLGLTRLHKPSHAPFILAALGLPMLMLFGTSGGEAWPFGALGSVMLVAAAAIASVSFLRSVAREQPGSARAKLLRLAGVTAVVAVPLLFLVR
jgi:hypothetical protein